GGILRIDRDYAQVRLECRKWIIRNFGTRRRHARQQSRFAGIGESHQADVGEQLQLQPQAALLTRESVLMFLGRAMDRRSEACIASSAASATANDETLVGRGEVVY